ncbi:MAG: hypothetical protein HY303_14420 [Candidatus Wallbacteria bacterium]|nr:hypothetical protein [Candidatus Wallbacteria bacterium]
MRECAHFDLEGPDGREPPFLEGPCRSLGLGGTDPDAALWRWRDQERRFRTYGKTRHLAVIDACRARGQLSLFINSRLADRNRIAYFGLPELFEEDAAPVLAQLLTCAQEWCREQGAEILRGPISYSTWYPHRFVLQERSPDRFPGDSPYPVWLARLFMEAGFSVVQEYFSVLSEPLDKFLPRIIAAARFARARGVSFERLEGASIPRLFPEAHALSQQAFAGNFSFTPIDYREFTGLYSPAPALLDSLTIAARDESGNLLGFAFGYGAPQFRAPGDASSRVAVLKTIAVDARASDRMVGAALSAELHGAFADRRYDRVVHALMARQQYALGSSSGAVEPLREYVTLERRVDPGPSPAPCTDPDL